MADTIVQGASAPKFNTFVLSLLFGSAVAILGIKDLENYQSRHSKLNGASLTAEEGVQMIKALHGVTDIRFAEKSEQSPVPPDPSSGILAKVKKFFRVKR